MKRRAGYAMLAVALSTMAAHADVTKQECVDANMKGQSLQRDGKLRAAKEALLVCASASCPAMVRDDCTQQLDALNRKLPSILFEVKDAEGNDVTAVTIMMDGQPLTDHVGAAALPIDPGEHTFTFTMAGASPVSKHFLLREGDKDRRERIVFSGAPPPVQPSTHETPVTVSPTPPIENAPRANMSGSVRVHFQQPEPTYSGATETWTLRDHDGKAICQLPCTQSVGSSSGYFMDAVVSRNGGEVVHQTLRINVPDSLDRLPGSEVQLVSKPGWGSANAALVLGVVGLVFFSAGGILFASSLQREVTGEFFAGIGVASVGLPLAIIGLVWGLSSQRGKFALSPLGASVNPRSGVRIGFSPFGIAGSF